MALSCRRVWKDGPVENYLTLDGLLNVVTEERTEAGSKVTTSSVRNSRNQVTKWGGDLAAWDANGNVTSFRGRTYHYDAENRLVSANVPGGSYDVLRDASGRKVRETLTASGSSHAVDVVQDGDRTLETFAVNEGVPLESLVYGRGIDEVVRADLDPDGDGFATTVLPIQDELGNVAYLTGPDGAVLERYDYETYGRFRIFAPDGTPRSASTWGWNRLFQGREYLSALEAYDFRNRVLLPSLGRFAQEDPLGYVDSLNLYQAFGGSWVNATDPWGLETGAAFGAIDRRDRGITNPIAGTIDPEAVAREAAATAVEEFSYVGIANGLSSSLLGYDFVRNEEVKGPLARVLAAVSVVPGIPATVRRIDEIPGLNSVAKAASEGAEEATKAARGAVICGSGGPCKVYEIPAAELTTGKPYIGKTRRSIPQRMADKDHRLKTPTGKPPKAEPLAENLTPEEAAGVEALLAQERGLENLSNKIPPLDPTLPKNAPRIEAARKLLERERGQ